MKKLWVSLIVMLMLFGAAYADNNEQIVISGDVGINGFFFSDKHFPIDINVSNEGDDFKGKIRVLIPVESYGSEDAFYSLEYDLTIPGGEQKQISDIQFLDKDALNTKMIVQAVDEKDNVVGQKSFPINYIYSNNAVIGILADSFDSMRYIKNVDTEELIDMNSIPAILNNPDKMLDIVFISGYDSNKLTDEQVNGLERFVKGGGKLIIGTGGYGSKTYENLSFVGDIKAYGNEEVSLSVLESITGIAPNSEGKLQTMYLESTEYTRLDDLFMRKSLGMGEIIISGISFADESLGSYNGADNLIKNIASIQSNSEKYNNGRDFAYEVYNIVSSLPKDLLPSPTVLILFIMIFVLIVGPITYIILSHIDKRDYGIIVIFAIVVISIAGVKLYGFSINSGSDILNQVTIIKYDKDQDIAKAYSYVGFKGSKGDVDLSFDKRSTLSNFEGYGYEQKRGILYSKYNDDYSHIVFNSSKQWDFNTVKATYNKDLGFESKPTLKVVDGVLKLDFKNTMGFDITDAYLIYGERALYLNGVKDGESLTVDKKIEYLNKYGYYNKMDIAYNLYNVSYGTNDIDEYEKQSITEEALKSENYNSDNVFLILNTNDYETEVIGKDNAKIKKSGVAIIPLELEFTKSDNVVIDQGVISPKVSDVNGLFYESYNNAFNGVGSVELIYEPIKNMEPSTIHLSETANQYNGNAVVYEVFNFSTSSWEEKDMTSFTIKEKDLDKYYSSKTGVRVRALSSDYSDVFVPSVRIEGEVK